MIGNPSTTDLLKLTIVWLIKKPTTMLQISKNAGLDASVIVNKVVEAGDVNTGYDASNGEFVNMLEAGIVDPTKVTNFFLYFQRSIQIFKFYFIFRW